MSGFDMSSSDAEDLQWERHQERLRSMKRKRQLIDAFVAINPSLGEAREAWTEYQKVSTGD